MKKSKGYWQSIQLLEFLYFLLDTFVGCEINLPIAKKAGKSHLNSILVTGSKAITTFLSQTVIFSLFFFISIIVFVYRIIWCQESNMA